jgi:hypothetical protein
MFVPCKQPVFQWPFCVLARFSLAVLFETFPLDQTEDKLAGVVLLHDETMLKVYQAFCAADCCKA